MFIDIKEFIGLTFKSIDKKDDELIFTTDDNKVYKMFHYQDCCENVTIDDIWGDLDDLIGSPIIIAEESTNSDTHSNYESFTWTFYKFATAKGYVDIRWYGVSNGYYSERVDIARLDNSDDIV